MQNRSYSIVDDARRVYDTMGAKVFGVTFEQYLHGTDQLEPVPEYPAWPAEWSSIFDSYVLVDGRIEEKIGLDEVCRMAHFHVWEKFRSYEPQRDEKGIRWMYCQRGTARFLNLTLTESRSSFRPFEVGMNAVEGVFCSLPDSDLSARHQSPALLLPGSVNTSGGYIAYLGYLPNEERLQGHWMDLGQDCLFLVNGEARHPALGVATRGSLI